MTQKFKVVIRRDRAVKPTAEEIDGKIYDFSRGWVISDTDSAIYVGETAWIPQDARYPETAPVWIGSGDLESV